jgi:hypothetical protein
MAGSPNQGGLERPSTKCQAKAGGGHQQAQRHKAERDARIPGVPPQPCFAQLSASQREGVAGPAGGEPLGATACAAPVFSFMNATSLTYIRSRAASS